eukprot:7663088-Karenia_brevis.AAC.1
MASCIAEGIGRRNHKMPHEKFLHMGVGCSPEAGETVGWRKRPDSQFGRCLIWWWQQQKNHYMSPPWKILCTHMGET